MDAKKNILTYFTTSRDLVAPLVVTTALFALIAFAVGLSLLHIYLWLVFVAFQVIYFYWRRRPEGRPSWSYIMRVALWALVTWLVVGALFWGGFSLPFASEDSLAGKGFWPIAAILVLLSWAVVALLVALTCFGTKRRWARLWLVLSVASFIVWWLSYQLWPMVVALQPLQLSYFYKYFVAFVLLPPLLWLLLSLVSHKILHGSRESRFVFVAVVLSALLTALSFPHIDLPLLRGNAAVPWLSLIPFFMLIYKYKDDLRFVVGIAFLWEALYVVFLLYWLRDFADLGVAFLALIMPMFRVIPLLLATYLMRRLPKGFWAFVLASGFLFCGAMHSYGFLAFPWEMVGYTQVHWPGMLMLSRYGGVWLVSFVVLFHNALLAQLFYELNEYRMARNMSLADLRKWHLWRSFLQKKASTRKGGGKWLAYYVLYGLLLVGLVGYHATIIPKKQKDLGNGPSVKRFAVLQPMFDPWQSWQRNKPRYYQILSDLTRKGAEKNIDFVLWTESSTLERFTLYRRFQRSNEFQTKMRMLIREIDVPLLTGSIDTVPIRENGKIRYLDYNALTFFDQNAKIIGTYRKNQLVPFGEWFPYDKLFPGVRAILDSYGASIWEPGKELNMLSHNNTGRFGPLVCYEGIFPRLVRDFVHNGADYFMNLTNLMWTDSYAGHMQHARIAQMRAMEQNRFFVRAANDGLSCVIDPYGRMIQTFPLFQRGVYRGKVDTAPRPMTFYGLWGDWFLYLVALLIALLTLVVVVAPKGKAKNKDEVGYG